MLFFILISLLLISSALAVVVFKNPIYSALALIVNLLGIATLFAAMHAHFLAAVQVVVYAGAIMVLVVFVLMLLNIKIEPDGRKTNILYGLSAGLLGLLFVAIMAQQFMEVFKTVPLSLDLNIGSVANMGRVLYTKYVFPFEAASVLIMAAIVGAVALAKQRYRGERGR